MSPRVELSPRVQLSPEVQVKNTPITALNSSCNASVRPMNFHPTAQAFPEPGIITTPTLQNIARSRVDDTVQKAGSKRLATTSAGPSRMAKKPSRHSIDWSIDNVPTEDPAVTHARKKRERFGQIKLERESITPKLEPTKLAAPTAVSEEISSASTMPSLAAPVRPPLSKLLPRSRQSVDSDTAIPSIEGPDQEPAKATRPLSPRAHGVGRESGLPGSSRPRQSKTMPSRSEETVEESGTGSPPRRKIRRPAIPVSDYPLLHDHDSC